MALGPGIATRSASPMPATGGGSDDGLRNADGQKFQFEQCASWEKG
jgi:hypothetical protein